MTGGSATGASATEAGVTGGRVEISIGPLTDDLVSFYQTSGMDRGTAGKSAISWAFAAGQQPFCIARLDGKVVGLSSYIQSRMKLGHAEGSGAQAVDSYVAPEMRGKGLFTTLAKSYAEHAAASGMDLVWGFPNDNAAPAWFGKLGWERHGQVPFLVKPLRAGYILRKLRVPGDFPLSRRRDEGLTPVTAVGDWVDDVWDRFSANITCATIRGRAFLNHRLFAGPAASDYRVVADPGAKGAIVATREAEKHGGRIAYLMEAMGGNTLPAMLNSEMARLRTGGTELVLAWSYPWSPNYKTLRACGFYPLPERLRPIRIWFGARPSSALGICAQQRENWYLSYLDSDTV